MNQLEAIIKHLQAADNIAAELDYRILQSILKGLLGAMYSGERGEECVANIAQAVNIAVKANLALVRGEKER